MNARNVLTQRERLGSFFFRLTVIQCNIDSNRQAIVQVSVSPTIPIVKFREKCNDCLDLLCISFFMASAGPFCSGEYNGSFTCPSSRAAQLWKCARHYSGEMSNLVSLKMIIPDPQFLPLLDNSWSHWVQMDFATPPSHWLLQVIMWPGSQVHLFACDTLPYHSQRRLCGLYRIAPIWLRIRSPSTDMCPVCTW